MIFNLKIFLNILHFSSGPQDLPASSNLLKIIILLNILIGMMAVDPNIDITVNIFFALIYVFVTLLFIRVCLNIKDKNNKTSVKKNVTRPKFSSKLAKNMQDPNGDYMWLFGGFK